MSDLLSRLESRKMPTEDVLICLDHSLLAARTEALEAVSRAQKTARAGDRMVTVSPDVEAARAAVDEAEAAIRDASIRLRIRGVDRVTYNSWFLACPPRKGIDQGGYNPTTFFMHAARNSAVYVDETGAEHEIEKAEWDAIDKALTDGEHDRLAAAVLHVNRESGRVDVAPFVSASETIRGSSETSASRGRSASPRAASGAGSRKKSTSKKSTSKDASE